MRHTKRTIEVARELQSKLHEAFNNANFNPETGVYEIADNFRDFDNLKQAVIRLGWFIGIMEEDTEKGWEKK